MSDASRESVRRARVTMSQVDRNPRVASITQPASQRILFANQDRQPSLWLDLAFQELDEGVKIDRLIAKPTAFAILAIKMSSRLLFRAIASHFVMRQSCQTEIESVFAEPWTPRNTRGKRSQ